ncbi:MAG TPA: FtsX-like permease family protein [Thermoanaerobaculia bacterium]|nr:FtsX-like permease family protein [Thermoanaerobaculia bacterium]
MLVAPGRNRTVIGIVGDVHHGQLGAPSFPQAYVPMTQFPWGPIIAVMKTTTPPGSHVGSVREVMRRIDPDVPVFSIATLDSLVSASEATRTFILGILAGFSAVALGLGMIGIYGVLSFAVTSRRREVGIRMALGATAARVFRMIVGDGMRVAALALAAGFALSLAFGRFLEGLLFGVGSRDPVALGLTFTLLAITSLLAAALPGARAARLDPAETLKEE